MHQNVYLLSVYVFTLFIEGSSCEEALTGKNVRQAKKNEFPFVVSLSYNNPEMNANPVESHFCGGALITERHVLTAAHCFDRVQQVQQVVVKTNDGNLYDSQIHRVKKWTSYHEWTRNNNTNRIMNDISVVELHEKIDSPHVKPARITCLSEAQSYGKKVAIAGWGIAKNEQRSQHLLVADDLYVINSQKCRRNLEADVQAQMNSSEARIFMCTLAEIPVHTELGDSGGPVFLSHSHEIIAVHNGFCGTLINGQLVYRENVHISIDHYREFINHVIECQGSTCCK